MCQAPLSHYSSRVMRPHLADEASSRAPTALPTTRTRMHTHSLAHTRPLALFLPPLSLTHKPTAHTVEGDKEGRDM